MSLGSGPYIIQHYFTEELNYQQLTIGSIFIVFPLIFYIVPALLLGLLSWEVVPLNGNDEEAAIALETEKYRQWGKKTALYILLDLILFLMVVAFFENTLGW